MSRVGCEIDTKYLWTRPRLRLHNFFWRASSLGTVSRMYHELRGKYTEVWENKNFAAKKEHCLWKKLKSFEFYCVEF